MPLNTDLRQVKLIFAATARNREKSKVPSPLSLQHTTETSTAVQLQWRGGKEEGELRKGRKIMQGTETTVRTLEFLL